MKAIKELCTNQPAPTTRSVKCKLGVAAFLVLATVSGMAETRYVNVNSPTPVAPFLTWKTAATNIQDAVDAASAGDEVVVTNGVYQLGGEEWRATTPSPDYRLTRVVVTNAITLRSVNGPTVTFIQGEGEDNPYHIFYGTTELIRCVYLAHDARLIGFTLTNGWSDLGGGVYCESTNSAVSNCIIAGNHAYRMCSGDCLPGPMGGGVYGGTLKNSTLVGNSAFPTVIAEIDNGLYFLTA